MNIQVHKEVFQGQLFPRKFVRIHVDPMVSTIDESQKGKSKRFLKTFAILITLDTKPWTWIQHVSKKKHPLRGMDSRKKTAIKAPIDTRQYNCMDKQDLGDVGEQRTINTNWHVVTSEIAGKSSELACQLYGLESLWQEINCTMAALA